MKALSRGIGIFLGLATLAAASYAAHAWRTYARYGRPAALRQGEPEDAWLERFMPDYEVVERHHRRVRAPAELTLAAAEEMHLGQSRLARAIFRARELALGAERRAEPPPRGLLAEVRALGWGVLAEVPGREIVLGAVTRPWEADVEFRALAPADFAAFREPGFVKIAWTLRADPAGANEAIFRTETRATATDAGARARFRRYWSLVAPGVALIRRMMLRPLAREAERRAASA